MLLVFNSAAVIQVTEVLVFSQGHEALVIQPNLEVSGCPLGHGADSIEVPQLCSLGFGLYIVSNMLHCSVWQENIY